MPAAMAIPHRASERSGACNESPTKSSALVLWASFLFRAGLSSCAQKAARFELKSSSGEAHAEHFSAESGARRRQAKRKGQRLEPSRQSPTQTPAHCFLKLCKDPRCKAPGIRARPF